jgi:hypothetical protein
MFLWVFLKVWEIQECYCKNQLKDNPTLTGRLVRRMMVRGGEISLKEKLKLLDSHESKLDSLTARINEYHKEAIAFGEKVKAAAPNDIFPNEPASPYERSRRKRKDTEIENQEETSLDSSQH